MLEDSINDAHIREEVHKQKQEEDNIRAKRERMFQRKQPKEEKQDDDNASQKVESDT